MHPTMSRVAVALAVAALCGCGRPTIDAAGTGPGVTSSTASAPTSQGAHWGYEGHAGPAHWGDLDGAFATCRTGRAQSPVDLTGAARAALPDLRPAYRGAPLTVWNTGHTEQVVAAPGSVLHVGDRRLDLAQLHLPTPSEHQVDGRPAAAEVHLVHEDPSGALEVLGIMVVEGPTEHPGLAQLVARFPDRPGEPTRVEGATFDPAVLLPKHLGYRTYQGSLTTPPYTEGVTWIVLDEPISASPAQLARLTKLMGHNARPVQPLGNRRLSEDAG